MRRGIGFQLAAGHEVGAVGVAGDALAGALPVERGAVDEVHRLGDGHLLGQGFGGRIGCGGLEPGQRLLSRGGGCDGQQGRQQDWRIQIHLNPQRLVVQMSGIFP